MIPSGGSVGSTNIAQQPSRTYKIDLTRKQVVGTVDGLEAVKQAVFKILQTSRFEHLIYAGNYGSEATNVVGGSPAGAAEVGRFIREALLQDDRITAVQDMQISVAGDEMTATFTVVSTFGSFQAEV
jgi:hypothetical protein